MAAATAAGTLVVIPITRRMTLLVTTAALVPLLVYGAVAWRTVGQATQASVATSNEALVGRGAEAVSLFLDASRRLLLAAAANLQGTNLEGWQQARILQTYVNDVPEFRELALFDAQGKLVASSRLTGATLQPRRDTPLGEIAIQPVEVDDDLLPRTQVTLRLRDERLAYLVAEIRLETIWRVVDGIRVGETGFAALVDAEGRLIADGRPGGKARVARGERLEGHQIGRAHV